MACRLQSRLNHTKNTFIEDKQKERDEDERVKQRIENAEATFNAIIDEIEKRQCHAGDVQSKER
jgi:hypothetical protein